MKKCLIIPLLILTSFLAKAQVLPINDTVRSITYPQYNPQWNYGFYQGYRLPYMYNSTLGKTDLMVTAKYARNWFGQKLDTTTYANSFFNNYFYGYNASGQLTRITNFKFDANQFNFTAKVNFSQQAYFISDMYQSNPLYGSGVFGVYALDNTNRMVIDTLPHVSAITVQNAGHSSTLSRYGVSFTDYTGSGNSSQITSLFFQQGNTSGAGIYTQQTATGFFIHNTHSGQIGVTGSMSADRTWNFPASKGGTVILDVDTVGTHLNGTGYVRMAGTTKNYDSGPTVLSTIGAAPAIVIDGIKYAKSSVGIQAAVNSIPVNGTGRIVFEADSIAIDTTIIVKDRTIFFEGTAPGWLGTGPKSSATLLRLKNGKNCDMFNFKSSVGVHTFFGGFKTIGLDGNKTNQTAASNGISVTGSYSDLTFNDVTVAYFYSNGLSFTPSNPYGWNFFIHNCWIEYNSNSQLYASIPSGVPSLNGYWINITDSHLVASGCTNGINIIGATAVRIANNIIYAPNKEGIILNNVQGGTVTNNQIEGAGVLSSNTYDGIVVEHSSKNIVISNNIAGNIPNNVAATERYGLSVLDTCDYITVNANDFTANVTGDVFFATTANVHGALSQYFKSNGLYNIFSPTYISSTLIVDGSSGNNYIQLRSSGTPIGLLGTTFVISGSGSTTDFNAYVYGNNSYGIWTNTVKRFSIDGSGNASFTGPVTATSYNISGAGTDILINGGHIPQSTFAPAAQGISSASIVWPGTLYTTPTTGVISANALTFSPALANQAAYSLFGNFTSGSGAPTFSITPTVNTISINNLLNVGSAFSAVDGNTKVVVGLTSASPAIQLGQDATHNMFMQWVYNATPANAYLNLQTYGNTNPIRIGPVSTGGIFIDNTTNSGRVGIGTTTPGSVLQINGGLAVGYSASQAAPTNGLQVNGHTIFEGVTSTGATGTNKFVYDTSPTLVTPNIGAATGTSLVLSGLNTSANFYATSAAPTVTLGASTIVGTGASITITGNNQSGTITLTTGTSISNTGPAFSFTMSGSFAYPNKCNPTLTGLNTTTVAMVVIPSGIGTTGWSLSTGAAAFAASTTYIWNYTNGGN